MKRTGWTVAGCVLALAAAMALQGCGKQGADTRDEMLRGFASPPAETRPWCYWYWISDNVSKDGITRDLEAMARVGIGGALIGNVVDPDTPLGNVKLLSDEWFDCMAHAIVEGKRLGVDIGIFNSPGWSQSGGPWITPGDSMRYVATSEIRLKGPQRFEGPLPAPAQPFQDIAWLAYPAPRGDGDDAAVRKPRVNCAPSAPALEKLLDGDPATVVDFPAGADKPGSSFSVDLEFPAPFTARSLSLHPGNGSFSARCELSAADAGGAFRPVCEFTLDRRGLSRPQYAVNVGFMPRGPAVASFPETTSRKFRLKTTLLKVEARGSVIGSAAEDAGAPGLAEVGLSGAARLASVVERQLGKMHPTPLPAWNSYHWPSPHETEAADLAVAPDRIVDLSGHVDADGTLRWDVPPGEWIVQRSGMTPTGAVNHPTTDQGRGPECDKMNREVMERHFAGFLARIIERTPPGALPALKHVIIDSYEVGSQNWTDSFEASFQQAFGYDPRPWLPVLAGRVVGSADRSSRFLWDLRRHVADRIATEYVGGLRDIARRHGLRLWLENYGHWGFPGEFLQYGGQSDDLGGEFWVRSTPPVTQEGIELRAASSAAHIYGKRQVYAEAFTSARSFLEAPGNIKTLGDWSFTQGINHLVFHVYIHQPWEDRKPGVNAWFGTEFNRHNTWFGEARGFVDYLRRCHFLLQRGRSTADIAYLIGEDAPVMTGSREPAVPAGYDFDYLNAEVLLSRASVEDGRIVLPDGPSYAVLVLPPQETMTPETLRRIRDLVAAGAAVMGPPPRRSPSLKNHPAADVEVARLADEIWGTPGVPPSPGPSPRMFGKGRIFHGGDLAGALRAQGAEPAVIAPGFLRWTCRRDGETDLYFLSNQKNEPVLADVSFRTAGRAPELWDPASGTRQSTGWFESKDGRTRVPLALDPGGSVFVVFRNAVDSAGVTAITRNGEALAASPGKPCPASLRLGPRGELSLAVDEPGRYTLARPNGRESTMAITVPPPLEVKGPWTLAFPPLPGAPREPVVLPVLASWHEHSDDAVKYFSGTAVYRCTLDVPAGALKSSRTWTLDLGAVECLARVRINGRDAGLLWKEPYAAEVTEALRTGANEIEIAVTNLWWNRLVGDDRLSPQSRTTFTTAPPRAPRNRLLPSGLLGPVTLRATETLTVP